jgi:prolyl-tRNA synthetase
MFIPTMKEIPSEATIPSHQLLLRGGFIRSMNSTSGLYMTLPMGLRVLDKIERLVDLAMSRCGGNKLSMPLLLPSSLWKKTGRWDTAGEELIRLKDRKGSSYCLAPTHEEAFTELVASSIKSWRQLDSGGVRLYQTGKKYRDEIRPRFGVMRSREFTMKDMYSFDINATKAIEAYNEVSVSYNALCHAIFGRNGWSRVEADTGNIGGTLSHEYQIHSNIGEDVLLHCNSCLYSANQEKMTTILRDGVVVEEGDDKENARVWHGRKEDGTIVHVQIMGIPHQRHVNDIKMENILNLTKIEKSCQVDASTKNQMERIDIVHGSTSSDGETVDVVEAMPGDTCPNCRQNELTSTRGIEIGHVFYLGDKYSKAMNAYYQNRDGKQTLCEMGCYGIGISRIAAAAVEQGHDENGIIWPESIAPYRLCILPIGGGTFVIVLQSHCLLVSLTFSPLLPSHTHTLGTTNGNQFLNQKAIELSTQLHAIINTDDIVVDDRSNKITSPGVKMNEANLLGYPWIIILGKDTLPKDKDDWSNKDVLNTYLDEESIVEIQERKTGQKYFVPYYEIYNFFQNHSDCKSSSDYLNEGFQLHSGLNE